MPTSKKIFIASTVVFGILMIFLGVYNLAFNKTGQNPQPSAGNNSGKTAQPPAPQTDAAKITPVSDEAVIAPILDATNLAIKYYSKTTGKVYSVSLDGTGKKTISDTNLPGLTDALWSPDGTKVITKFADAKGTRFYYYDYAQNKGVKLKDNLDTVVWQNNNKIFYKYYDPKTQLRTLNIANPDGLGWNKIADLSDRYISIAPIPRTGLVSFWNSPDAVLETDFVSAPILGGEKKSLSSGYFGADYLWNNTGSAILTSHADQKNGSQTQLALMNDRGGEYKSLGVATLVSKAVWSKDNATAYYALPSSWPSNVTLPNDYMSSKFNTADSFWKINTLTGEKKQLLGADGKFDATGLFLNADESLLFFINRVDGRLYRINL